MRFRDLTGWLLLLCSVPFFAVGFGLAYLCERVTGEAVW